MQYLRSLWGHNWTIYCLSVLTWLRDLTWSPFSRWNFPWKKSKRVTSVTPRTGYTCNCFAFKIMRFFSIFEWNFGWGQTSRFDSNHFVLRLCVAEITEICNQIFRHFNFYDFGAIAGVQLLRYKTSDGACQTFQKNMARLYLFCSC